MNPTKVKIMVVEDEPEILSMLREWLEQEGYCVAVADNGWDAMQTFVEFKPALTVTDLRMAGMDGFQVIRKIREVSNTCVMALTALAGDDHTIRGLESGADDYLTKPVSKRVFLARIRALIRRAEPDGEVPVEYSDSSVTLNFLTHQASARGRPLHLRPTEFKLLSFLVQNPERVISHQELLDRVWGDQTGSLDSLKWYISSLREKIQGDTQDPKVILTAPRAGYRYCPPVPEARP